MLDEWRGAGVYYPQQCVGEEAVRVNDYVMKIAICDHSPEERNFLAELTRRAAAQEGIDCELTLFDNSAALLETVTQGAAFHTLLLDAMLPEMDGIQLAAELRQRQIKVSIVFVSSNPELAMLGYEVAAARFLAKPAREDKLREALRFCYQAGKCRQELALPTARGMRKFLLEEIMYIETWGRGVRIHLQDGREEVGMKISELEGMLPASRFVLCHRTVLVNLAYVQYLRYCELELKTGAVLPVSKYRQNSTRVRLLNYPED